jgi:hypothetical protein
MATRSTAITLTWCISYAKLAGVHAENEVALVVKTADRLANVRACVAGGEDGLLSIYRGEQTAFRLAAFRPQLCDALWAELDSLLKDRTPDELA